MRLSMNEGSVESENRVRTVARTLSALLLVGIAFVAACQNSQRSVVRHEDDLAAAGFTVRPANTPERQDMLARLPPHKFVQRAKGDTVNFVYADPTVCNCLYVGSQQAYNQYKRDQQQKRLVDEQALAAENYSDAAWNWGAWGPWGPEYGFRAGPGFGW